MNNGLSVRPIPAVHWEKRLEKQNNERWVTHFVCHVIKKKKKHWRELKFWFCRLTFHTATACLENIGIHFHSGLRQQLVSCQVGVVWGGNEVIIQGLCHVLVHLIVFGIKNVTCRTPHEVCKTWRACKTKVYLYVDVMPGRSGTCDIDACFLIRKAFGLLNVTLTINTYYHTLKVLRTWLEIGHYLNQMFSCETAHLQLKQEQKLFMVQLMK